MDNSCDKGYESDSNLILSPFHTSGHNLNGRTMMTNTCDTCEEEEFKTDNCAQFQKIKIKKQMTFSLIEDTESDEITSATPRSDDDAISFDEKSTDK